jgi:hypothetical protein
VLSVINNYAYLPAIKAIQLACQLPACFQLHSCGLPVLLNIKDYLSSLNITLSNAKEIRQRVPNYQYITLFVYKQMEAGRQRVFGVSGFVAVFVFICEYNSPLESLHKKASHPKQSA